MTDTDQQPAAGAGPSGITPEMVEQALDGARMAAIPPEGDAAMDAVRRAGPTPLSEQEIAALWSEQQRTFSGRPWFRCRGCGVGSDGTWPIRHRNDCAVSRLLDALGAERAARQAAEAENAALALAAQECRAALDRVLGWAIAGAQQEGPLGFLRISTDPFLNEIQALLEQPPAAAVTRAGELLAAADVLAAAAKHADLVGYYSQQRHNLPAGLVAPLERLFEAQQAYRRLRAGHGGG